MTATGLNFRSITELNLDWLNLDRLNLDGLDLDLALHARC